LNGFITRGNSVERLGLIYDTLNLPARMTFLREYGLLAERKSKRAPDDTWVRFSHCD